MGADRIVSVTPASSYNLISLSTIKALLGIDDTSQDIYLTLVIAQASASVANYCNRSLVVEEVVETIWPTHDSSCGIVRGGLAPLQLTNWPIASITSVIETITGTATTLVVNTDFMTDAKKGQLIRLNSDGYPCRWKPNKITVSYSSGFATVPSDVIDATSRLIKAAYFARQRDPSIKSEMVPGVLSQTFNMQTLGSGDGNLPLDVQALLDNYRTPVIG